MSLKKYNIHYDIIIINFIQPFSKHIYKVAYMVETVLKHFRAKANKIRE